MFNFPNSHFQKEWKNQNGKILHGSLHYFEPINKYHNLSFNDIKDLTKENENFANIYLINKNNHKMILKNELIGFIYQNTTFKTFHMEVYQTNSLDLFSALYHLTYENENDINNILQINNDESINQVATFERKPNFKCKFNITKYNDKDKEFIQMFNFEHSYLTQEQFDKIVDIILKYRNVYATTKFDVGKTKVKLNLPMKKDTVFKKQSPNSLKRSNSKTTRRIEKVRYNFICQQRTIFQRQYIHKPSDHRTKRRITKNRLRR